jgi:hypothetical protein
MTILYVSCPLNKLSVIQVDESGNLIRTIQTVYPIVEPLPEKRLIDNGMTEWIDKCPNANILYTLTSFWNKAHAVVTAFAINETDGSLTKLGSSVSTQGFQAATGAFSSDGNTYVVGHHNCGTITVFKVLGDGPPVLLSTLKPPSLSVTALTPTPSTSNRAAPAAPSTAVHHVQYFPAVDATLPDVLVVADCAQDAAILYGVDDMGHFDDRPLAHVRCRPSTTSTVSKGWIQTVFRFAMQSVFQFSPNGVRLRRAVLTRAANKESFLYCLGELTNILQVYRVTATTGGAGTSSMKGVSIDPTPVQDILVAGNSLAGARYIGLGLTLISELQVYEQDRMVLIGVRGVAKFWNSKAEMGIRILKQQDDGRLELGQWIETPGAVRHFYRNGSDLFVGINAEEYPFVLKYALQDDGLWKLSGQAKVDMDVFCVVPVNLPKA